MNLYRITYKDSHDPVCPEFTCTYRGYDVAHAEDRFYESEDADGWTIVKIERIKRKGA